MSLIALVGGCSHIMKTPKDKLPKHEDRGSDGKYVRGFLCDCCGKTTGIDYCTDGDVCDGSDGPGFFICTRVRCGKKVEGLSVEERRAHYTEQRARNEVSRNTVGDHKVSPRAHAKAKAARA